MGKSKKSSSKTLSPQQIVDKIQQTLLKHKNGLTKEAIEGYEEVIPLVTATSTLLSLHGNVGALYLSTGKYEEAKQHFEKSIEIDTTNAQSHFNLAVLLTSKLNQHGAAMKHCALAIKYDGETKNHKYYHLMGNILQSLGKEKESERYYQMADSLAQGGSIDMSTKKESADVAQSNIIERFVDHLPFDIHQQSHHDFVIDNERYHVVVESLNPIIITVENFLTAEECQYIRDKSSQNLEKSFIMGNSVKVSEEYANNQQIISKEGEAGSSELDDEETLYRSSYNAWLSVDDRLSSLQERISSLLNLPLGYIKHNSEDLQVVKYDVNGQFKLHQDSSAFHARMMTVLFYLNDISSDSESTDIVGGETWFPFADSVDEVGRKSGEELSHKTVDSVETAILQGLNAYDYFLTESKMATARYSHELLPGVKVAPKRGKVVIFLNYHRRNDELNPHAVHAGLPIRKLVEGRYQTQVTEKEAEKWIANYWIKLKKEELQEILTN